MKNNRINYYVVKHHSNYLGTTIKQMRDILENIIEYLHYRSYIMKKT